MFNSELRNETRLVREFDAQVRGQREDKRGILVRVEKNERLVTISKRN